jgi:hypothetical protein
LALVATEHWLVFEKERNILVESLALDILVPLLLLVQIPRFFGRSR